MLWHDVDDQTVRKAIWQWKKTFISSE